MRQCSWDLVRIIAKSARPGVIGTINRTLYSNICVTHSRLPAPSQVRFQIKCAIDAQFTPSPKNVTVEHSRMIQPNYQPGGQHPTKSLTSVWLWERMAGRKIPSRTISYAFTIPALVFNFVILGVSGFLFGVHGPLISGKLVHRGQRLWIFYWPLGHLPDGTGDALSYCGIAVPTLAAILLNSLFLIPCYLVMILFNASEFTICVIVPNIVILILDSLALVLTVIDLIRVIRIRRAAKRKAKEPHSTAMLASAAEAADLVAEMRTMKSQLERLVEAQQRALDGNSAAGPSGGFDNTLHHSLSTMKREQSEALRETRPAATNLVVYTHNGVELMAGSTREEGPPEYSRNLDTDSFLM
ncbi:hypothetical protein GGX14DRAFT_390333 [Mycena pura]|uniref:Uncharacterized protein n=1 Tax=Mycena pura TaxID=153505 RepID=A0AAD6YI15_9AGAR|nr:hypothetical protein GGX14DRAFT_390333 [Mycena pura]